MKNAYHLIALPSIISLTMVWNNYSWKNETSRPANIIVLTSIPKSGTNLCINLLGALLGHPGIWGGTHTLIEEEQIKQYANQRFYITHSPCSEPNLNIVKKNNCKVILLLRDPRDVLVSYAYWAKKDPALHIMFHSGISRHMLIFKSSKAGQCFK